MATLASWHSAGVSSKVLKHAADAPGVADGDMIGPPRSVHDRGLLAQIVFCLVAAPILAAERWAAPTIPAAEERHDAPRDSRPLLQAAFDASDVRPEEVSDAGQKRGKSRSKKNGKSRRPKDTARIEWDFVRVRLATSWRNSVELPLVLSPEYSGRRDSASRARRTPCDARSHGHLAALFVSAIWRTRGVFAPVARRDYARRPVASPL